MNLSRRKKLLFIGLLLLLIAVPLTLSFLQQSQDTRSRASAGTTLSLIPQPGTSSFIEKSVGQTVPIDMMIDPGSSNAITFIRYQIKYDPTKLQPLASNPFTLNTTKFPTIIEGPVVGNGTISQSISVGSDPTKAIRVPTKVGTANFKAIAVTEEGPTTVTFTSLSQALSSGPNDQAGENVLTTPQAATISIIAITGTPVPTETPTPAPSPTGPQPTMTPSPTLAPGQTALSFKLLLHGIGAAGDNPNPTGNDLSNKNPRHQQRNIIVTVYDANDQLVTTKTGTLSYDGATGEFNGQVDLGTNFSSGTYTIKIKSDRYLRRLIPGVQTITKSQNNTIALTQLVAGDTNSDNTLNILDYSALLDCGYGEINPLPITNSNSQYAQQVCQTHAPAINIDLDDNGILNSFDYNLFLRELSVQNGD